MSSTTTVKALHQIHGVKGFDVITPGQVFECPSAVYDHLVSAGAVEDYAAPEVTVAKPGKGKAAAEEL